MNVPNPDGSTSAAQAFAAARRRASRAVDELTAKAFLRSFGIATPRSIQLRGVDEIAAAFSQLSPPLALKLVSPDVLHKSDVGGVRLHLCDVDTIRSAMQVMRERAEARGHGVEGFLLEEMAATGHELVVGAFLDRSFGPVIMCGLGGVFIEILRDVSFRICPITRLDAIEMIDELKAAPILAGARTGIVASADAMVNALLAVGGEDGLMLRFGADIVEVDINPLIVSSAGAVAVDARLVVGAGTDDV